MKISNRIADGIMILDLFGPFPESEEERVLAVKAFSEKLKGRTTRLVIVFHNVTILRQIDLGLLARCIKHASVEKGVFGLGSHIPIVAESKHVREVFSVVDSSFRPFETEEKALASFRR